MTRATNPRHSHAAVATPLAVPMGLEQPETDYADLHEGDTEVSGSEEPVIPPTPSVIATLKDAGLLAGNPFDGLEEEPSQLVARASEEALRAHEIVPSTTWAIALSGTWLALLGLEFMTSGTAGHLVWGLAVTAMALGCLPVGARLRDHAWYRPRERPAVIGDGLPAFSSQSVIAPLALLIGPLVLGLVFGMGWYMVLCIPASGLALLWLATHRLTGLLPGFPLTQTPTMKELTALSFAALLTAAGLSVTSVLLMMGPVARLIALPTFFWTWTFAARIGGLWARCVQQRMARSESRGPMWAAPN